MSRRPIRIVVVPVTTSATFYACTRTPYVRHIIDYSGCNCLRTELPIEAQAKSSGALGTPGRNHYCPDCDGTGRIAYWVTDKSGEVHTCDRCLGSGELTSTGGLVVCDRTDSAVRAAVSSARNSGKLGARK